MNARESQEIWRPVADYEGIYAVSNLGRLRIESVRRGTGAPGHVMALQKSRLGYLTAQLRKDGLSYRREIHSLVAVAFLGPKPPGLEVNHIDGKKAHNAACNLEYVTHSENLLHAYAMGLCKPHTEAARVARRRNTP